MKKLIYAATLSISMLLTACAKDKDETPAATNYTLEQIDADLQGVSQAEDDLKRMGFEFQLLSTDPVKYKWNSTKLNSHNTNLNNTEYKNQVMAAVKNYGQLAKAYVEKYSGNITVTMADGTQRGALLPEVQAHFHARVGLCDETVRVLSK